MKWREITLHSLYKPSCLKSLTFECLRMQDWSYNVFVIGKDRVPLTSESIPDAHLLLQSGGGDASQCKTSPRHL